MGSGGTHNASHKKTLWFAAAYAHIILMLIPNPINISSFPELVELLLRVLLTFAVPILMLLIVYSGFLFLTSAGDPGKRRSAQEVLRWAIIGFVVILAAWALVSALRTILGA